MSFLNPEFYGRHGGNKYSSIMFEDNRPLSKGNDLLKSITELLCTTEFAKVTGMSLLDILDLDYGTYLHIKRTFENIEKPKQQHLTETFNQLQSAVKK